MSNTEGGWTTVSSTGGWRARAAAAAAARGGAGGPSEPPMTRTSVDGWGRASGGGGRPMPAAFGGGERDRRNDRLEEQRQRAAADAERKRHEEREAAEAAKRLAKKMDFNDMEEYPSLGGGGAAAPKAKPSLDFRAAGERGAILSATREAEEEARAREEYYASYSARLEAEERAAHRRRLAQITTRCYDDGFYEHEPPEEDEDFGEGYGNNGGPVEDMGGMPEFEEDDEEGQENLREAGAGHRAAGEFNAHLAVNRRRGDKSDW